MATKKIQIIPPGYTDVCYPQTTASVVIEETDKKFMTDAEKLKLASTKEIATARIVVGTSAAGWTAADCDYLCDGTDDQTEINAAITALPATGGEIVILDGTYNITAKIDVTKDNVSIVGNGNATILKRMFDSDGAEGVITLTGVSGCKIADLQVDGNKGSYMNPGINYGILLISSSNNTITGNACNDNTSGIYLYSSGDNTITGNTCNNNNTSGIYLSSSSYNTITCNTCNNNNTGIYLSSSSNNNITGNNCNNNTNYSSTGISLSSSSYNTITGNACNDNTSGIYLSSSSNRNTITGNTCNNNEAGISLSSSSSNTITGNTCNNSTASQHTIQLSGTGNSYNLISNNNCMGKAVTNEGGTGNTVFNNKFDDSDDIQAHTHTLANITDSGNLAALNTNASTSNYLRGDGTWVTPPNTTYSAMSVAEGQTGTATSSRVLRADYLKQIIEYWVNQRSSKITVSPTAPTGATSGDMWINIS